MSVCLCYVSREECLNFKVIPAKFVATSFFAFIHPFSLCLFLSNSWRVFQNGLCIRKGVLCRSICAVLCVRYILVE